MQKELDEALPVLYGLFEHVHAMTAEQGGILTRWNNKGLDKQYRLYIERKRLIDGIRDNRV